ncbi:uncharacterized protein LOC132756348 isoform X2 [Ruditapes philippinarum]|nr:uncharacterized protein LOC132756348 isoform X2 [Ruditapes philippinarum]
MASGSESEAPYGKSLPGDAILRTFEKRMDEFSGIAKSVAEMHKSMQALKDDVNDLKRKTTTNMDDGQSSAKRVCEQKSDSETDSEELQEETDAHSTQGKDNDDIDIFLSGEHSNDEDDASFLQDLEEFYTEDSEVGPEVDEKLAHLTTSALQANLKEKDEAKIKEIKDRQKRPKNTPWLQVPQIDDFLWRRLNPKVKAADYILQRCHGSMAATLVPLTKALGQVQNSNNKELKQNIGDAFKLLTNAINKNIQTRRERIRRTVHPRYRNAIQKHQHSAGKLFGDNLQEEAKSLISESRVNLMYNSTGQTQQSFLDQRRGPRYHGPNRQNNQHNNQHKQNFNNYPKKMGHQNRGGKQKRFYKTQ